MNNVFISYSHKDENIVCRVCRQLEEKGVKCWYASRDIKTGSDWAESIVDAIKSSDYFLLIFTDNSNNSKQVYREIELAINKGLKIIPLKLSSAKPTKSMEYYTATLNWINCNPILLDEAVDKIYSIINSESVLKNKSKNRFLYVSIIFLVVIICSTIIFLKKYKSNQEINIKNVNYDILANQSNGSISYYNENEVYYFRLSNSGDGLYGIYEKSYDTLGDNDNYGNLIYHGSAYNIVGDEDNIYFTDNNNNIHSFDLTERKDNIISTKQCDMLLCSGDNLIYRNIDDKKLYSINKQGENERLLIDDEVESYTIIDSDIAYIDKYNVFHLMDSYQSEPVELYDYACTTQSNYLVLQASINNKYLIVITDDNSSFQYQFENDNLINYFVIDGNNLYFIDSSDNSLYKYCFDTDEKSLIYKGNILKLNIINDYLLIFDYDTYQYLFLSLLS